MTSLELARQALRGALEIRRRISASSSEPICIFDLAEQLGIEVVFRPESSLGGLYNKTTQTILIPTYRPAGRQAFTCAHEIGHWFFGHGTSIDEINDVERYHEDNAKERLVDIFASYLLMPPRAVREAYSNRNWEIGNCAPMQAYVVAGQLGVGYETLVQHMRYSLRLISNTHAKQLVKTTPKQLRHDVLGADRTQRLVLVDLAWAKVAVDLQVGDLAIVPNTAKLEGRSGVVVGDHELGTIIEACQPGVSRIELPNRTWSAFVRVSRKDFIGRSIYRHLEDPDVNERASNYL
jgi:Zn-dependent peptidase ImmA (M78 family)